MKLLIVDDESEIRNVLRLLLENKAYEVLEASSGAQAIELVRNTSDIDMIIMDVMMPGISGIEATRTLRNFTDAPVLFLTANSLEQSKIDAYAAGGDDYLVKPFSARELLLKVEALTRRYNVYRTKQTPTDEEAITLGHGVLLLPARREVFKNGLPLDVRDKELDVLIYLARHRGVTVSPHELYEAVWGERPLPSSGNTVTVHVLNLRRTLEDRPSSPKIIRTVWGKGYQIDE
ncbi:MAG: response regulator transcription factor [Clostridia bacterium]|nr:response regulator transcription factor [Clostridia bacterium]